MIEEKEIEKIIKEIEIEEKQPFENISFFNMQETYFFINNLIENFKNKNIVYGKNRKYFEDFFIKKLSEARLRYKKYFEDIEDFVFYDFTKDEKNYIFSEYTTKEVLFKEKIKFQDIEKIKERLSDFIFWYLENSPYLFKGEEKILKGLSRFLNLNI